MNINMLRIVLFFIGGMGAVVFVALRAYIASLDRERREVKRLYDAAAGKRAT